MKYFSLQVRHSGNVLHTIPMSDVSDREVRLLRKIHGDDAIIDLKQTREEPDPADLQDLYRTLATRYSAPLVEKTFGVMLDNFDEWLEEKRNRESGLGESARPERAEEAVAAAPAKPKSKSME